jgi:hypothetical protein
LYTSADWVAVADAFVPTPGALDHFTLTGYPTSTTAGTSFGNVVVTAYDSCNEVKTDYTGRVYFTSTDPQAVLPSDYPFVLGDAGTKTFTGVILKTAGTQSITAADGSLTSAQTGITVDPAALDHFTFGSISSPQVAGAAFSVSITAQDQYGNTVSSYIDSNTLTASAGAVSPSDTGAFVSGTKILPVTVTGVGSSLTLTTTGAGKSGASNSFDVISGSVDHFTITSYPSSVQPGQTFQATVTAYDAYGNINTAYTGQVYFTSTDPQATLPYTSASKYTFSAAENGVHQFSGFALQTAGSQTITVTDGSVQAPSGAITVASTVASSTLSVSCSPSTVDNKNGTAQTVISGTLTVTSSHAGIPSRAITVSYFDGTAWNTIGTATTNAAGVYYIAWVVPSTLPNGFHPIKAEFSGDGQYLSCSAVTSGDGDGIFTLPEYLYGGLVALLACFGAFAIFKKRSSLPHLNPHN